MKSVLILLCFVTSLHVFGQTQDNNFQELRKELSDPKKKSTDALATPKKLTPAEAKQQVATEATDNDDSDVATLVLGGLVFVGLGFVIKWSFDKPQLQPSPAPRQQSVSSPPVTAHQVALEHPLTIAFKNVSYNQRCSISNLFLFTAVCDGTQNEAEMRVLNMCGKLLGLNSSQAQVYMEKTGNTTMEADLRSLTQDQKHQLAVMCYELMECDGKPNLEECKWMEHIFPEIGLPVEEFVEIIKKSKLLYNEFKNTGHLPTY
jgi:uncharacterized tellurite resistance protein B-like protein